MKKVLITGASSYVGTKVEKWLQQYPEAQEIILIMAAVNHIDLTAQEMLSTLNQELAMQDKRLHFSFIKGPVMDIIGHTPLIDELSGQVYLSTIEAVSELKNT